LALFHVGFLFWKEETMTSRPQILAVVSALLLVAIPCSQAQNVNVVSPQAFANTEGSSAVADTPFDPFRYQQIFPAADFAALGGKPHWITSFTVRPDQSLTTPRTATFADNQVRLSTTAVSPTTRSDRFDDNFGVNITQVYRGQVTMVADANTLSSVPRKFYQASYPQGFTPFLYDPSQGNLLLDVIGWGGMSPSTVEDKIDNATFRTGLFSPTPGAVFGDYGAASIFQFTFAPVPEPTVTLMGVAITLLAATARRRRGAPQR